MEARVAHLESDVGHIKSDVAELKQASHGLLADFTSFRVDFARLETNVSHLPSKGYILVIVSTGVTLVIGVLTLLSRMGWLVAGAAK